MKLHYQSIIQKLEPICRIHQPFMMYSFSTEPGIVRALNRLLRICSVNGATSGTVKLTRTGNKNTN